MTKTKDAVLVPICFLLPVRDHSSTTSTRTKMFYVYNSIAAKRPTTSVDVLYKAAVVRRDGNERKQIGGDRPYIPDRSVRNKK